LAIVCWRTAGKAGLADRSRRPQHSPGRRSAAMEGLVLAVRDAHPAWGGRKIRRRLQDLKHLRFRFFGREAVETFFLAPLVVPEILLGAALYLFYARLAVQASIWTLLCGHLVICTPYVIRSVTAGLVGLDPRLEEAAMSLGATRVQAFFKVTLPLLRSILVSGAIFAFIISFSDINLALFLSGPQSTSLPVHIFSEIQWQGDPTIAAASSMQIVIIGLLILVVQRIFRLRLVV
jgi:ABC-type spermidine/putrescine transport system permease subunit II